MNTHDDSSHKTHAPYLKPFFYNHQTTPLRHCSLLSTFQPPTLSPLHRPLELSSTAPPPTTTISPQASHIQNIGDLLAHSTICRTVSSSCAKSFMKFPPHHELRDLRQQRNR
ncbi:hypothetical protein L1987_10505 [Smallanthus sonchifolius]|uniref:Uncharacterized protein n=1 Tax=Smallanthus sonchifolius TaxID=185202 RepID=A0ACB9JSM9_9ASTR|nr:hypothetical protein L1987_10505 [Smallanthus sonchifolius]